MRILLDHCVDWRLARSFPGHKVRSTRDMGWERLKNGQLLAQAAAEFDVFVTTDQHLRFEQNLATLPIAVIELNCPDTRLQALLRLSSSFDEALKQATHSRFIVIRSDGRIEIAA